MTTIRMSPCASRKLSLSRENTSFLAHRSEVAEAALILLAPREADGWPTAEGITKH